MIRIDIVAAVRGEEETLPTFIRQLRGLVLPPEVELGAIFVEDSSRDDTLGVLRRAANETPRYRFFALARGFGQGPAIVFGLTQSTADACIMLDVDGSHPLSVVPEMIRRYLAGARVVQCRRRSIAGRDAYRDWGAAAFHWAARCISGVDLSHQNIYYRLVDAEIAAQIVARPALWPWLRFELPTQESGAVSFVDVDTAERTAGASKYDLGRLLRVGVDGMLAVTSLLRIIVLSMLAFGSALLLSRAGSDLLATLVALPALAAVWHYFALRRADTLAHMRVIEASGLRVPPTPPPGERAS